MQNKCVIKKLFMTQPDTSISFDQNTLNILLRHLLTKTCGMCLILVSIFHISQPYSNRDFRLKLNSLI